MQHFHSLYASNFYGSKRDYVRKINEKAKKVDIDKVTIGCIDDSGTFDYDLVSFLIAVAMERYIGGGKTEAALIVREFIPIYDFVDVNGDKLADNSWNINVKEQLYSYQDWSKQFNPISQSILGIQDNKYVKRVMAITGVEYDPKESLVDELQFWVRGTKLIDRHILNRNEGYYKFKLPFIVGLTPNEQIDRIDIKVTLKRDPDIHNQYTNTKLRLTGYVIEPIGVSIIG